MDGKVVIGTEIDDTGFNKDLKRIENNKNLENNKISIELDVAELDKQYQEIQQKIDKLNKKATIEYSGSENMAWEISPNLTEQELQEYERLTDLQDEIYAKKEQLLATQEQINGQTAQQVNIEKDSLDNINKWVNGVYTLEDGTRLVKKDLSEINTDVSEIKNEVKKMDFSTIKKSIDKVGKSVERVTKKVVRWGLAIFGIRSAYMFVRQAMSKLSQYDKQMATDIEYMRYAIANTLKPVIEGIIELAKKLMFYVGYIAKGWFGINIYAHSTSKDFKKANDEAKKLQKTLAGFDEMDVVSDSSSQNGTDVPSFNLGNMQDMKVPSWLEWISKNGPLVVAILSGIAGGLLAIKTGAGLLKGLGIGLFIFEIVMLIEDIIKFLKDPTWENFLQIIGDIAIIIGTVIFLLGGGGIVGAILILVGIIIKNWDKIKGIIGPIADWVYKHIIKPIIDFFVGLGESLCAPFQAFIDFVKETVKKINKALEKIKPVIIDVSFKFAGGLFGKKRKNSFINAEKFSTDFFKIPKLARGGIVNNPGSGVMMGNYIAGEGGPEAVLPLTDGTLQKLANMIPITVNVTNTMNGRVISKELQKVQNENNFAYNR